MKNNTELLDLCKNNILYNIDNKLYEFELLEVTNKLDLNSIISILDISIINSLSNNNNITKLIIRWLK